MARNIFWNLTFFFDFGGCIALALYALARWPWLVHRLELLFYGASCLLVLLLAVCFILARMTERRYRPGVRVGKAGIIHEDIWRDD